MSAVAQKRDLSGPAVVQEFAATVKDERHLTALYLLTVADIRGTSPKVWNAWKGKLLEDLYKLTLAALGGAHADAHTVLTERKEEAARLTRLVGLRDDAREAFWNQLDVAYFLRRARTGSRQGPPDRARGRPADHGLYPRRARSVRGHLRLFRRQEPIHSGRADPHHAARLGAGQLHRAAARRRQRPARASHAGRA
ncbi:hypothetical protein G6F50_014713 [Rhizopus delemar]|uniref:Uncharacterized protein n=1 Tax=Rhizopus delemar TaxID=936053 RepID=A0A9P6Y397_9FUNG|nr:hypothetical protein G6F50_014713 [Rhizopus delemar]